MGPGRTSWASHAGSAAATWRGPRRQGWALAEELGLLVAGGHVPGLLGRLRYAPLGRRHRRRVPQLLLLLPEGSHLVLLLAPGYSTHTSSFSTGFSSAFAFFSGGLLLLLARLGVDLGDGGETGRMVEAGWGGWLAATAAQAGRRPDHGGSSASSVGEAETCWRGGGGERGCRSRRSRRRRRRWIGDRR